MGRDGAVAGLVARLVTRLAAGAPSAGRPAFRFLELAAAVATASAAFSEVAVAGRLLAGVPVREADAEAEGRPRFLRMETGPGEASSIGATGMLGTLRSSSSSSSSLV